MPKKKKVPALSKRAAGKRLLTVYLWDDQYAALRVLAKRVNRPMTKLVRHLIADIIQRASVYAENDTLTVARLIFDKATA